MKGETPASCVHFGADLFSYHVHILPPNKKECMNISSIYDKVCNVPYGEK